MIRRVAGPLGYSLIVGGTLLACGPVISRVFGDGQFLDGFVLQAGAVVIGLLIAGLGCAVVFVRSDPSPVSMELRDRPKPSAMSADEQLGPPRDPV